MITRQRLVVAVLWAASLVGVARWTAHAQGSAQPGVEVRFLSAGGEHGKTSGALVANFGGQWLPVKLEPPPDGNMLMPR